MSRHDPIRDDFYTPLERAELASEWLFHIGAALSISSFFVTKETTPELYPVVMIAFGLTVLFLFTTGLSIRFYFSPRAEDSRRKDFFSNAFNVNLTHRTTDGYYNNDQSNPIRRVAAQLLENSLFSKIIVLKMLAWERIKLGIYIAAWLALVLSRQTDFGLILAVSQAIFGEQIIARWVRLEWIRLRFEKTYDRAYVLLANNRSSNLFKAEVLDALTFYEATKSNASMQLSSRIFDKINPSVSQEWEGIKKTLKL